MKLGLKKIKINDEVIFGIDNKGEFRAIGTDWNPFTAEHATDFSLSSTLLALINEAGECKVAKINQPHVDTIALGAVAVGCTRESVFVLSDGGLFRYYDGSKVQIQTLDSILSISCSENDVYFLDAAGRVFKIVEDTPIQVFGLPPVAHLSVGVQHVAAVTSQGELYTWGYNPSGQLGIGSDRPLQEPKCVLTGVELAFCGHNNTWVIKGQVHSPPTVPKNGQPNLKLAQHQVPEILRLNDRL